MSIVNETNYLFTFITFLIVFDSILSQLQIVSPTELSFLFSGHQIKTECLNCEKLIGKENKSGNLLWLDEISIDEDCNLKFDNNMRYTFVIINEPVQRSKCDNHNILLNLESNGVEIVIINYQTGVDNLRKYINHLYYNLDDHINVPLIGISNEDGSKIQNYLSSQLNREVILKLNKEILTSNAVTIDIYMTKEDKHMKNVIDSLLYFKDEINKGIIKLIPHFISFSNSFHTSNQCICGKLYCVPYNNPAELFKENLLQKCVSDYFNLDKIKNPFEYVVFMNKFIEEKEKGIEHVDIERIMSNLNVEIDDIYKCYKNSFSKPLEDISSCKNDTRNSLLELDQTDINEYLSYNEKVFVNNRRVFYFEVFVDIKFLICGILSRIDTCPHTKYLSQQNTLFIIFVVLVLIILGGVGYYLYKRLFNRKIVLAEDETKQVIFK